MFADVVLPVPLPGLFTYALPEDLQQQVVAGCRVLVPFGAKKTTAALVVRVHDTEPQGIQLKNVLSLIDEEPVVLPWQLPFWQWIADYYMCTLGEVYKAALPAQMKKGKRPTHSRPTPLPLPQREGSIYLSRQQVLVSQCEQLAPQCEELTAQCEQLDPQQVTIPLPLREGQGGGSAGGRSVPLSPAQSATLASIHAEWRQHSVCLLHGVTSSGKTEIYIQLIAEAVARGEQVLYLLPEIVLTSQLTDRLRAVFGDRLGVYHSKYSDAQRADIWQRQLTDYPYDIIVGVRSSVFLPFQRLGLVIVDEEHETSFKQQDPAPRYHARNVAIMLAARQHALTLLGTATPALESYYNARMGKYGLVTLSERFGQVQLPRIEVIDVKELRRKRLMEGPFSPQLLDAMRTALDAGEQVILFQNRRGFATQMECHVCGWVPHCPHCDVALTLHKRIHRLTCHYCGYTTDIPTRCPACEGEDLRQTGFGTERIEDDIHARFPAARIARMDLDTTRTRSAYEGIIHDFAAGETDILVGTQMVTKGLDFERVSLVAILSADTMLNLPDFRAWERAFQMMTQVAGRAGRRERQGLVLLQTLSTDLPIISQVVAGDYAAMYTDQMLERRQFAFPPFVRLIIVYIKHRNATTIDILARDATLRLQALFGTRVLGPDEPPVARVKSLFIRRVILKLEQQLPASRVREALISLRAQILAEKPYSAATIFFDVDPL